MESDLKEILGYLAQNVLFWLVLVLAVRSGWRQLRLNREEGRSMFSVGGVLFPAASLLALLSLPVGPRLALDFLMPDRPFVLDFSQQSAERLSDVGDVPFVAIFSAGIVRYPDGWWEPTTDSVRRVLRARAVAEHHALPLSLSGGVVPDGAPPEADVIASALRLPEDMPLDRSARNTFENAQGFSRIARQHGWEHVVVATDWLHMRRAAACVRAAGLEPVALLPSRTPGDLSARSFVPSIGNLASWRYIAYEFAALGFYLAKGRLAFDDL